MKKFKRFISLCLIFCAACTYSVPAFASEPIHMRAADNTVLHDFLVSGLVAAEAVSEFEKTTQTKFDTEDYSNLNITDEWKADTETFLKNYLASSNTYTSALSQYKTVSLAEAKATSIAYSIDCAEWSISQNRAADIATEAEYMFISHYVDRKDYFWNQGDPALLLDGEQRSGPNGVLAKWITNSDRQSYNAYMDSTKVSSSIQRIGNIALGYNSLKGNYQTLVEAQEDLALAGDVFSTATTELILLDSQLTGIDVLEDSYWLVNQINSEFSKDPNVRLDTLFQRYMEDESIFLNYGEVEKKDLIQNSIAVVSSYALGGCAGVVESVLGNLKSTMIGFTVETYTDFFNYVAWLALQYGYSGRYAMRFADYERI